MLIGSMVWLSDSLRGLWLLMSRRIARSDIKLRRLHVGDDILRISSTWYKHRARSRPAGIHFAFPSKDGLKMR